MRHVYLLPEESAGTHSPDRPTIPLPHVKQSPRKPSAIVRHGPQSLTVDHPRFDDMAPAELEAWARAFGALVEAYIASYEAHGELMDHAAASLFAGKQAEAVRARRADVVARMEKERNLC